MGLIVLALFFVLMWVLFVLPQQRRMKAQQAYLSSLEVGDEVITTAGVFGTILDLDPATVRLEVAEGVVLTVARAAIGRPQADLLGADDVVDLDDDTADDLDTVAADDADDTVDAADPSSTDAD